MHNVDKIPYASRSLLVKGGGDDFVMIQLRPFRNLIGNSGRNLSEDSGSHIWRFNSVGASCDSPWLVSFLLPFEWRDPAR